MIFTEMHEALGRPPLMLVDLRPVNRPVVLVTNHEIAEQVSQASKLYPTSAPKSDLKYLTHLTGPTSLLASHGDDWKALRKRFNPGFAPQYLMTLLPCMLDKSSKFIQNLDILARAGTEFSLVPVIVNLTFDIIGAVVMDVDLEAQHLDPAHQGELIRLYSELLGAYTDDKADLPWWLIPRTEMKRRRLGKRIDVLIKGIICRKHTEQQIQAGGDGKSRSILSLSLQDTKTLTPELIDVTCDQLKTFLLAGHDTTSAMLAYCFYELSRTPRVLNAVRDELNRLLGTEEDPEVVRSRLLSPDGPNLINRMSYISAVIKETLRLHPPAATARYVKPGTCFTVRGPAGEDHCLDGVIIYNCETLIHRDRAVYGNTANDFVPERWLSDGSDSSRNASTDKPNINPRTIPASAWRPFERGPRSCIGQEFANIEARVIIAVVARRYDFTKVGLGELATDKEGRPVLQENGQYKTKSHLYNTRQVTSKPVDGMKVRVKLASKT
ncbi:hypothetical protein DL770_006613 [Monosporascus sp. CRB-9-2]|nr:hypothetical protein DL770_006613 [Monosporascus sp. CRB-9-2]